MSAKELKNLEAQLDSEIQIMKTFNPYSPKLNELIEMKRKVSNELNRLENVTIAVQQERGRMRFGVI